MSSVYIKLNFPSSISLKLRSEKDGSTRFRNDEAHLTARRREITPFFRPVLHAIPLSDHGNQLTDSLNCHPGDVFVMMVVVVLEQGRRVHQFGIFWLNDNVFRR